MLLAQELFRPLFSPVGGTDLLTDITAQLPTLASNQLKRLQRIEFSCYSICFQLVIILIDSRLLRAVQLE